MKVTVKVDVKVNLEKCLTALFWIVFLVVTV
jgi:hypothetical protein